MIANLYIHSDSFKYNGIDSEEYVLEKLRKLITDMRDVIFSENKENRFKVPKNIFDFYIYGEYDINTFAEKHLDGDEKGILYCMIANIADDFSLLYDELENKCFYSKHEKEINSIIIFNKSNNICKSEDNKKYIQFDKYEIVYDKHSWITLRRQILGNHPETNEEFIENCRKYFNNLIFSDNCIKSLSKDNYLQIIPRKIVYYLSCLNDKFYEVRLKHTSKNKNANDIIADFSGIYNLDEPGSLERNCNKKNNMKFYFRKEDNSSEEILCEPHLKISQEDINYNGEKIDYKHFHPRIYFCFDHISYKNKILIGSIGPHL